MRLWSHDRWTFPLPEGHRYPLAKYRLIREWAQARGHEVAEPEPIAWDALTAVHDAAFVARMRDGTLDRREERVLGLPWSPELVHRARIGTQGTVEAARDTLRLGAGMVLGGGTHHAGRSSSRGYCVFNDVAVATHALRFEGLARRVLVVDVDVHQGDGTAELLGPDPDAFTLSVQCERNYPFTRIPSDLDVELPRGTGDDLYLGALDGALTQALEAFPQPDLAFLLAGADPYEGDALGRLSLTKDGLRDRDALVVGRLRAAGIPVCATLAGGYAPDVDDIVDIHAQTVDVVARALTAAARPPTSRT
ncbi:histone deacetylase [Conexibacter sp. SYSU D00693]|uniref:histone deacetylase family protein n=1 Tax=Conexibacter sp. SYSU D00693 TaxID=2812560 RepID=UPI00196A4B3D|nr:histone deacetylase [Conexibacter sp. SYSU D00693]